MRSHEAGGSQGDNGSAHCRGCQGAEPHRLLGWCWPIGDSLYTRFRSPGRPRKASPRQGKRAREGGQLQNACCCLSEQNQLTRDRLNFMEMTLVSTSTVPIVDVEVPSPDMVASSKRPASHEFMTKLPFESWPVA